MNIARRFVRKRRVEIAHGDTAVEFSFNIYGAIHEHCRGLSSLWPPKKRLLRPWLCDACGIATQTSHPCLRGSCRCSADHSGPGGLCGTCHHPPGRVMSRGEDSCSYVYSHYRALSLVWTHRTASYCASFALRCVSLIPTPGKCRQLMSIDGIFSLPRCSYGLFAVSQSIVGPWLVVCQG